MKKVYLAAVAVALIAGMSNCKKEDKTPTEVQDAPVVKTLAPGETIQQVVGDEVSLSDQGGEVVATGGEEVTEATEVNNQDQIEEPAIDENNIP